ncbi:hypothetical protein [Archangium lansingense]|uniref:Uncharacterized protein n=1 Tax=Archangium lansingense TaxID=2995310 RepID=A0ABT4A038_9BACT|nr:hypothetical protein [Archangium lansinium]MCY1074317.1 hypothetical protein [Archangium lansinium]
MAHDLQQPLHLALRGRRQRLEAHAAFSRHEDAVRYQRAAVVQLAVPVVAAVGGVLLLGESLTPRLVGAGSALLCGVFLALLARQRKAPAPSR